MGVELWVGGHAWSLDGEPAIITGPRMFSPVYGPPPGNAESAAATSAAIDSGAFSDPPERRLTPAGALDRQLAWEERARRLWGAPDWQARYLVSHDLLIDEKWAGGERHKERWSEAEAWDAVNVTVEAAHWLAAHRDRYAPRIPILACQGVTPRQYLACVQRVLLAAQPGDVIGYGGFCILGRWTSWLPTFATIVRDTLPLIASHGIRHVHIFGVLYRPALVMLLYYADQYGIRVSTDSAAPVKQCIGSNAVKSGRRRERWQDNVQYWVDELAGLRASPHYRPLPEQMALAL